MPRKKAKPASKKPQTKTSFVLSFPHAMTAKDVVAKGKAAGLTLTEKHVWAIRSDSKKRKSNNAAKKATAPKKVSVATTSKKNGVAAHNAEDLLRTAALALGLPRAMSLLQAEHDRMRRLLGG